MEQKLVLALGMFDGVHIGHRALLEKTRELCLLHGAMPGVYTFLEHPLKVLGGEPRLLTTPQERKALLVSHGMQHVEMVHFSKETAACPPEEFVRRLVQEFPLSGVVCGFNFSFGSHALGTPEMLREFGNLYGFSVDVVAPVVSGGEPVSSSRIRRMLELEGDVSGACTLLGRPYSMTGKVVRNLGNGHKLGFPTANLDSADLSGLVFPKCGVYVTEVLLDGSLYPAITNVGNNPTFQGKSLSIESHLMDFDGDLYGKQMRVDFLKRIRGEIRFDGPEGLSRQIAADQEYAHAFFLQRMDDFHRDSDIFTEKI